MIYWHNSFFGKKQIAYWITKYYSGVKKWSNRQFLQNQREKWKIWTWEKKSILPHFQSQCQYRSGLWGRLTGPKEERTYPPTSHEETRSMVKYKLWLKDWLSHFRSKIYHQNQQLIHYSKWRHFFGQLWHFKREMSYASHLEDKVWLLNLEIHAQAYFFFDSKPILIRKFWF